MSLERTFGDWLRQRRRALDLTQEELAQEVGCSAITLRKLEAEERRPSKQIAERLAEALNVSAAERADFLRFARGDPFASPADAQSLPSLEQLPAPRHNLPVQLTSFIGREKEIAEVTRLLSTARLVTLTGAGGAGKTRLALQAAAGLLDASAYPDGVWLVELAPLGDPAFVASTVATTLGVKEMPGRPITDVILDHLRPKRLLLVLDNCEHLVQACAELAETLLRTCPRLTILASSREGLGVAGESTHHLGSLSLPDPKQRLSLGAVAQSEAVQLFVARATAVTPHFKLTSENAPPIARVCQRLDGIPLAIELAAARLRMLSVEQIAARLDDRFRLLTGGSRTKLPRHQTLQALIDWSYDLLIEPERVLLRRLAVFAGGWTLEAAEAVCSAGVEPEPRAGQEADTPTVDAPQVVAAVSPDVFDQLGRLIDKSLVVANEQDGAVRYAMLETIRQYGLAKLAASGEADAVRRRHARYYLALAESTANQSGVLFDRRETEQANLRDALTWSNSALGGARLGLRLVVASSDFWTGHGYWSEARGWLEAALARADDEQLQDFPLRAEALWRLGYLSGLQGDYATGQAHTTHSLELVQELGDQRWTAVLTRFSGWLAREQGDAATARLRLEEGEAVARELGDEVELAWALVTLGEAIVMQDDAALAASRLEEGLALFRKRGTPEGMAWALNHLGHVAQIRGDFARARQRHEESLPLFRESSAQNLGNLGEAWALQGLGETALAQGSAALAAAHLQQALAFFRDLGDRAGQTWCLAGLAGAAAIDEDPERAARLWGAAEALRQAIGARPAPAARATRERLMAETREQLGEGAFTAEWAEGAKMTLEQAVELALWDVE